MSQQPKDVPTWRDRIDEAHAALTAQAPAQPADFVPRLMAVVKIYQEQAALGIAVDAELFRAVSRLVAAQALPALPQPPQPQEDAA